MQQHEGQNMPGSHKKDRLGKTMKTQNREKITESPQKTIWIREKIDQPPKQRGFV